MDRGDREFIQRLAIGPSFVLLGQRIGSAEDGSDLLLSNVRLDPHRPMASALAEMDAAGRRAVFADLAEAGRAAEIPVGLDQVGRFPWNGVFTSMVDSRVPRAFVADWRRVTTAVGEQRIRHPRSPNDLTVRLLFGGTGEPDDRWPPATAPDMATRRSDANRLLLQLTSELITPRGILAIDGWSVHDWLTPEDLYAAVTRLQAGQAHLFSVTDDLREDEFVAGAVARGAIILHRQSLPSLLRDAESRGMLPSTAIDSDGTERVLRLADTLVPVPRDEWSRVLASARPVDVDLLTPPGPLLPALEYQRFRTFLGRSEGSPDWAAVAAGYPFRRSFEEGLLDRVQQRLTDAEVGPPLVVEGQAGSGKSTALSVLAARVAARGEVAVLHASRLGERLNVAAVDQFALWAEEQGAAGTLLVWDGMADVEDYFAGYQQLRSRGRRVLIVGSAYRMAQPRQGAVLVPAVLEGDEPERIRAWLARFGFDLPDSDLALIGTDASFLAALYRLLPESRPVIERGLTLELRTVESDMERYARNRDAHPEEGLTLMAAALLRAGVELPAFEPTTDDRPVPERDFTERSTAEQLTGVVLVAGRRGLRVPLDLVLRVVGREGFSAVLDAVKRFDIIRWSGDESGDQYLGTRTALEAELLARSDLRDARAEAAVIRALLSEVKPAPGTGGGAEVQFALDLLRLVGPDSPDAGRFRRHYLTFAESLAEVRERPGGSHPRLTLMEANLRREYVVRSSANGTDDQLGLDTRLSLLRQAREILEIALDQATTPLLRQNLLVELASTLGSEAYELSRVNEPDGAAVAGLTRRIVDAVNEARALDPESFYPVDVIGWVCLSIVRNDAVDSDSQVGLVADMFASFASVDPDTLSPGQRAKYDSRLAQVAALMNNTIGEQAHLDELRRNSDPAALYLLALHTSRLLHGQATAETAGEGLQLMLDAPAEVRRDWRCARLTLDLFWLSRTGKRFLHGERESLAFDDSDWNACLHVLDQIELAAADSYRGTFLRGLALFHLRQYRLAMQVFAELERFTGTMSRRVIATYVASDSSGSPARFNGQVRFVAPDNRRGRVWVDSIGQEMTFIPYRFSRDELANGDPLPEFFIAFNLRGAYADPVRTARPTRPVLARE